MNASVTDAAPDLRADSAVPERWWTVALSEELDAGALLAICCQGIEYVLFRDSTGAARALRDQCAHRRAPLSLGRLTPEKYLECPYHGWRYDGASGQCVGIPNFSAEEKVPRNYRTGSYKIIEQDGFIHMYTGGLHVEQPAQFPARIRLGGLDGWRGGLTLAYPHEYLVDLLMDAPGAVLEIPGVAVINNHRYGDPLMVAGCVVSTFAADRAASVRGRKKVVGDYPLALVVSVAVDGHLAEAKLQTDAGEMIATVGIGMYPDKPPLSSVRWRGTAAAADEMRPLLAVRTQIDAHAVKSSKPFASRLRKTGQP
jgi:nitrite reductase/ring-hydroxylating ferredoxin subunit